MKSLRPRLLAALICAAAAAAVVAPPASAQAVDVAGVKLEPVVQVGPARLQLNGAGLRTKAIFKVYVAALYVPQKSTDATTLIEQKGARRVSLTFLRDIDATSLAAALNDGLTSNHTAAQLQPFKAQIAALNASMAAAGDVKKGDTIVFDHGADSTTRVSLNGQLRGAPIAGDDFFSALLHNWLGSKPVDDGLKKALLGA